MENFKTLKIYTTRMEAEVTKSYLEINGIKTLIVSDDAGQMYPPQATVNGVKLMVSKKNISKAKELLENEEL